MTRMNRIADRLLTAAASRWPRELREDLLAEWRAELAWLRQQPATAWRQMRFAASLAVRGPDGSTAPVRRRLTMLGRSLAVLLLAGAGTFLTQFVTDDARTVRGVGGCSPFPGRR